MSTEEFTSLDRVLKTLSFEEPDRVPLFLFLILQGANELGLSIQEYFSKPENVVKGQLILRKKYNNDCVFPFFYAAIEIEAWGGEVLFFEDGSPNSGKYFIQDINTIPNLEPPDILETPCLNKVLEAIKLINEKVEGEAPLIGIVMSPFSIPIMQLGFRNYLDLIYNERSLFDELMKINEKFCVEWANIQLEAGITAIGYFDPFSSPTIIPRELNLETGFHIAKRTLNQIKGPTATHFASGRSMAIIKDVKDTGTSIIGVSALEDLRKIKNQCLNELCILGNLNGIEMCNWTPQQAQNAVKLAISKAGKGGGFILSDNHGEIPSQVPEEVLYAITKAVEKWGKYPLDWIQD